MEKMVMGRDMTSKNYYKVTDENNDGITYIIIKIDEDHIEKYFDKEKFIKDCEIDYAYIDEYDICFITEEIDTINEVILQTHQFIAVHKEELVEQIPYPDIVLSFQDKKMQAKYMIDERQYWGSDVSDPAPLQKMVKINDDECYEYIFSDKYADDCEGFDCRIGYSICVVLEVFDTTNYIIDTQKCFILVEKDEIVSVII